MKNSFVLQKMINLLNGRSVVMMTVKKDGWKASFLKWSVFSGNPMTITVLKDLMQENIKPSVEKKHFLCFANGLTACGIRY